MRFYLMILGLFFTIGSFAQPTGDIEKDTILANQYYTEALQLMIENPSSPENSALLKKAIVLYEAHPFDEKLIKIKGTLALQFNNEDNLKAGGITAEEVIDLVEKEAPHLHDTPVLLNVYKVLSFAYNSRDHNKSIKYALKALAVKEEIDKEYFHIANNLLSIYSSSSKIEETETLIKDLESILNNQEDDKLDQFWLIVYSGKRSLYKKTRNYEQAILYSRKVFIDNEKYKHYSPEALAPMYMDMGVFLTHINQYEEALEWAEKGMAIGKKNPHKAAVGSFYGKLGYIYGLQKKYEKAIENLEHNISYLMSDSVQYAIGLRYTHRNIAMMQIALEEYENAIKSVEKSKTFGLFPLQDLTLAMALGHLGKYEEALTKLQNPLIQLSKQFTNEDINENPSKYGEFRNLQMGIAVLSLKGKLWYEWGEKEKNKSKLLNSYNTFKLLFIHLESSMKMKKGFDSTRFKLNNDLISTLDYMIKAQAELYELEAKQEAFDELLYLTERRKALQLIETLSPSSLPDDILNKEQNLLRELNHHGQKLDLATYSNQKDSILFYQNALFETNQVLEKHLEMIKNDYPKESNDFYNTEYATLEEIKADLSENTLLIEYNMIENDGFVIAIGSANQKVVAIDVENLKNNIQKLNELIQDRFAFQKSVRDEFIDLSHELYKTLIEPTEAELEGKTKLMIVVEGQLFHLPFELLLASNEKKPYHELDFLIKKYEVNYHYSATAFFKLKEKPTVQDNSLLAFAPVFTDGKELTSATRSLDFMIDSLYQSIDNHQFVSLPNTKKEVNRIAEIIQLNKGETNILLNENATKINLSNQLENQSYQFVHIATHGLVNFKNPKLSALACYSKNEKMDNLFYANEIQFKNINADLVVLSSCESGIGQLVAGEGLIALNRSFIYSGAKNVLFSLWKVNDKYSSELMIDFYDNYFKNQSYTAALRNAKLKMLSDPKTAQPKFWAPFVLMGE